MSDGAPPLVTELHCRVGRNLLLFQEAEECLRLILPYAHPEASKQGVDAMRSYRRDRIDGKPLGTLIGQYNESVQGDLAGVADELKEFLAARNELVHHFYRNPRFTLMNEEGAKAALAYLDEQYERARGWVELFRTKSLVVLLILIDNDPSVRAEYGMHRSTLIERLPEPLRSEWRAGLHSPRSRA